MTNKKEILLFILGVILLPILLTLFVLDRIMLVFLLHLPSPTIREWWRDSDLVGYSIIRLVMVSTILALIYLVSMWV
jgi:hypothetical protein